jgi:predicted GIY-YIG superfamily endonuclease
MEKRQLIEQIRQHNQTATQQFLSQFDENSLQQYLQHLEDAKARKRQISSWSRQQPKMKVAI